jgi:hypothetical protein
VTDFEPTLTQSFKTGWGNGTRPLLITVAFAIVAAAFFVVSVVLWLFGFQINEDNPLRLPVPQQTIMVPNAPETFKSGGLLTVLGTKCNDSGSPITITGTIQFWESQDEEFVAPVFVDLGGGSRVLEAHTCETRVFFNEIPNLPNGDWRLAGENCTTDLKFCRSWFTDTIEIVN